MAIMYPDIPYECSPASREEIMFDKLKNLPEDYYVFHSFKIVSVDAGVITASETDFVVFHPDKGILCIEAKAGKVKLEGNKWKYASGDEMSHGGPYRQAENGKWRLRDYIKNSDYGYLINRCKLLHAVWFPSVDRKYVSNINLPSEADMKITLTSDSLDNIEEEISAIFDIELPNKMETKLTAADAKLLIDKFLAPTFDLVPIANMKLENQRYVFKRMLKEQVALLNYLEEQDNAVINGLAGTGKTIMAVEKARRHAENDEPVLFLCYNHYLKEYLQDNYGHPNISFYTIDGLACNLCDTVTPNYERLKDVLEEMYLEETFPYQHIIIDEGQDFGKERLNDISVIELLKANVVDEGKNGTFYLFYDENQMVQAERLPSYIGESDCKLTLYRNCRNTENIATTSLRLLGENKRPKLFDGAIVGDSPEMFFADDVTQTVLTLNSIIEKAWAEDYTDIQILTCKTEESSIISDECSTGAYLYKAKKIPFTTCRKYKGLEADVVIMVDLENDTFENNAEQVMYVGSSRARYKLSLICNLSEKECEYFVEKHNVKKGKKVGKSFATMFNAKHKVVL
ncbi:MAG: NERD domain-containing protein [Acutalibacteraceae bacterium]